MEQAGEWLRVAGNVALCASALFATSCVVVYARVPWRRTRMGKHLMAKMAVIAAILDLGVLRLIVGDPPWFLLLRTAVFLLLPFVLAWRLRLLWQAQHLPTDIPREV